MKSIIAKPTTTLCAAKTRMTFFPTAGALTAALLVMMVQPTNAHSARYYNCADNDGCKLVDTRLLTSNYSNTQYPVVLSHGLFGFNRFFGALDYFYGIPQSLMSGGSNVYATKTPSVNSSEVRGEQLLQQVKIITAISGKPKVNLMGHSQGGIDIRYVAGVAPQYVASVTAISSPEQGSKTADDIYAAVSQNRAVGDVAAGFAELLGGVIGISSGSDLSDLQGQDGWNAVIALSTDGAAQFNAKFPAALPSAYCAQPAATRVNGINYYSFSGVGQLTNALDAGDAALFATGLSFKGEPNDGLVSSCSSRLGYVIRDNYVMNHLDSANQVLGLTAWGEPNPKTLYRAQVNRLKNASL